MVRELHVAEPERVRSWEEQAELYYEFAVEGVDLPDDFREMLSEEYSHLAPIQGRAAENLRAWEAYLGWAGDVVEDDRTPRARLDAYFREQEKQVG